MTDLVLRTCNADGTSYGGFKWPLEVGERVEAPDWNPAPYCGGGLHGLFRGEGNGSLLNWDADAVWLAVEPEGKIVDLDGKVKFSAAVIACVGDRETVTAFVKRRHPDAAVVGATATAGYRGTATAGYRGTATAGDWGTATAGNGGTATAGDFGAATAGYRGTATAGDFGTATAGDEGAATAGDWGTATAGYRGAATAGYRGTATAGDFGTATAGNGGTATAGDSGMIAIKWLDGNRYRLAVGYVGEDGIKPNTAYRVKSGQFVEVEAGDD